MKRILFLMISIFALFGQKTIFEKGNSAYENANYKQALEYYQQILDNGLESSALYFNMANSHFKLNELGKAILFYEKAKKLSPLDEAIKANLKIANEKILDDIQEQEQLFIFDLYNQVKFTFTINQMLYFSLFSFLAFFLGLWLKKWFLSDFEKILNALNVLFLLLFFFWAAMSFARISNIEEKRGVLITQTSEVYTSPNDDTQAFVLHEGSQFQIERKLNDRYEIRLIDGKTGWIDISNVGVI